jgi:hypothetical protein
VGVGLGDHVLGSGRVFLEVIRLPVRVQRRGVIMNLKMNTWFGSFCDTVMKKSRQPGSCTEAAAFSCSAAR